MNNKLFTTALLSACMATAAHAENPDLEAFLGIDYTNWSENRDFDEEFGIDGGLSLPISKNWSIEGWLAHSETEITSTGEDVTVQTISINALNYFDEGTFRPFYTFGLSRIMADPDNSDSDDYSSFDFGVGAKKYFENNIILRGDFIGRFSNEDSDIDVDPVLRLTVGYAFGGSKTKKAPKKVAAPKPEVINTPAPKPVAVDTDKDGVYDSLDKCPGTAKNLKVDSKGCKVLLTETVSINLNVNFANNSDVVEPSYFPEIKKVATFMQQYDGTVVEIRGYTDDRGRAEYNKDLSDRRAKAVAEVLANEFNINTNRISANGYGEANPIADNTTSEGRAKNRRVVAEISTKVNKEVTK